MASCRLAMAAYGERGFIQMNFTSRLFAGEVGKSFTKLLRCFFAKTWFLPTTGLFSMVSTFS